MKTTLRTVFIFLALTSAICAQTAPRLNTNTNAEIIAAMTLEEKAGLLVGTGMRLPGDPTPRKEKVPGAAGATASITRFGIPALVLADGPAGLRIAPNRADDKKTYFATAFPTATLLASTWDVDLVYRVGASMGDEVKEYGVDILLAPGMNIHRNALGGRNFEYYSEDPLLTGKMASAMVRGVQSKGVGTSIKHFAANNHETNRMTMDVKVGERALREIYLRGFEIAVKEAKPWTVMTSYNKINGTYTSEQAWLVDDILRREWGFKGFVMTDWFAGTDPVKQMKAGNNLIMPGLKAQQDAIVEAVKTGQLREEVLDRNIDGILKVIRLSPAFANFSASNGPDLKAHAAIARRAAAEGMVLLKNREQALPIGKRETIAAFGNHAYELVSGGTGSGDVNEAYTISLVEGLKAAGFPVSEPLRSAYESYLMEEKAKQDAPSGFLMPAPVIAERELPDDEIAASTSSDLAIVTIGRTSGEFADRRKEGDYYLTDRETDLIKRVSEAFHAKGKKVIVVLNTGGVIETASWRDSVDAVLLTWLPGQEAGHAITDILCGRINPSGKLPTTFLKKYEDDPTSQGFPGREYGEEIDLVFIKTHPAEIVYDEGIYVGYRAFEKERIAPAYEFGYGLSYTTFEYGSLELSSEKFKNGLNVAAKITNTGKVPGRETVQLYLSAPAGTIDKPVGELKGFAKTRLLKPGESQVLTMALDMRALASFDETKSGWVAEKGVYVVKIGASSLDIRLKASFDLDETLTVLP